MCGIAGFAVSSSTLEAHAVDVVRRMTDFMTVRGPDAEGVWGNKGVVLGHRRLAILDLEDRAIQPMKSYDGRYTIVFNGEIYNFKALRRMLEANGETFRTTSDTEVLLALFAREGERLLLRLRGMFAFAIWDAAKRELFLARDPYGIKPLYYASTKEGFLFASQVKALVATGVPSMERDSAGLVGFYLWGSVPEPWTLFRGVFSLPAGHWLRVRAGVPEAPVCWHDIRTHWQEEGRDTPIEELQDTVRRAVTDSVKAHLVSDVPVCVFLSGGIDSGTVAGLASETGAQVEGITIGFEEFAGRHDDEIPVSRAIATHYGLKHHVHTISKKEFEDDVQKILMAMDQPSIDGVNTWFASKVAAERGYKVVLSGIGGDELFCGYSLFQQIPSHAAWGRVLASIPGGRALLRMSTVALANWRSQPKLAGVSEFCDSLQGWYFLRRALFLPSELPSLLGPDITQDGLNRLAGSPPGMTSRDARDSLSTVGMLESTHFLRNQLLRDGDWASMAHSVELRTPLVDATLLQALAPHLSRFRGGTGKSILAQSPIKPLPTSIMNRRKTGFSIPMEKWLSKMSVERPGIFQVQGPLGTFWARRWATAVVAEVVM